MARLTIYIGVNGYTVAWTAGHHAKNSASKFDLWPELDGCVLHPSLHGDLADLAIADSADGRLVVCTHSDAFVMRVRRRIAEGSLAAADAEVVYVKGDGSTERIAFNDRGTPLWWPKDYLGPDDFHAIRRVLNARDALTACIHCSAQIGAPHHHHCAARQMDGDVIVTTWRKLVADAIVPTQISSGYC